MCFSDGGWWRDAAIEGGRGFQRWGGVTAHHGNDALRRVPRRCLTRAGGAILQHKTRSVSTMSTSSASTSNQTLWVTFGCCTRQFTLVQHRRRRVPIFLCTVSRIPATPRGLLLPPARALTTVASPIPFFPCSRCPPSPLHRPLLVFPFASPPSVLPLALLCLRLRGTKGFGVGVAGDNLFCAVPPLWRGSPPHTVAAAARPVCPREPRS